MWSIGGMIQTGKEPKYLKKNLSQYHFTTDLI